MRGMRVEGGNHYDKLGLERILCACQFTIANMAGTTSNPVGQHTNTLYSKPNQISHTPDVPHLLVSCVSFPSSFHISLSYPQLY